MAKTLSWTIAPVLVVSSLLAQSDNTSQGFKNYLLSKGIELTPEFIGSTTWDMSGGKKLTQDGKFEFLIDIDLKLHSDKAFKYHGGTFDIDFQMLRGGEPSKDVGSYDTISQIEAPPFTQLAEFWYKQSFYQDKCYLKVGKNDAFYEFLLSDYTLLFQDNAFLYLNTIEFFPAYPDPAMGVIFNFSPSDSLTIKAAVYDGSLASGFSTGTAGIFGHFFNHLSHHAFLIGEVDSFWNVQKGLKGKLGFGVWKNTNTFQTYAGTTKKGTGGGYILLDQMIYDTPSSTVGFFFQWGFNNALITTITQTLKGGFTWLGVGPKRPNDNFGFGYSWNKFNQSKGSPYNKGAEGVFEVFYVAQIRKWIAIEPDVQYIVNPGGQGTKNALVALIQVTLSP